jgi:nucleoside-diphosphate-sugar epimerase
MPPTKLIVGYGYLGERVAELWRGGGDLVLAVSRREEPTAAMTKAGAIFGRGDVTNPETLNWLVGVCSFGESRVESLLYAVGYDRSAAGPDIHAVYAGGLQNVLAALPPTVTRVVYISTTGVYGAGGGEWVDEQTPPDPQRDGGRASLAAEQILAAHPLGRRSAILRLAGIYGPGRVPNLALLRTGEPIAAPSAGWLNLIHVDDAARVVVAADRWLAERPAADGPHLFCVSDGHPVIRADYYAEAARLADAPSPKFIDPPADSPAAARARSSRRINSDKVWRELGVAVRYTSYREGLAAILSEPHDS